MAETPITDSENSVQLGVGLIPDPMTCIYFGQQELYVPTASLKLLANTINEVVAEVIAENPEFEFRE